MESNIAGLIGIGVLVATSLAAFAIYKWRQQKRVGQVNRWVNDYLSVRYGELPAQLTINCSHDTFWPVLVRFNTPGTGIRHSLQFACRGKQSAWFLLSEKDEQR
jgi:hypothetical protein